MAKESIEKLREEYRLKCERKKEEYNEIPVVYCKNCLSLNILSIDNMDYCDKCGSTDTAVTTIEQWEVLYEKRYGRKLLDNKK